MVQDQSSTWPKGVAAPAIRALNAAGFDTLEQLDGVARSQLVPLHGMGPKALRVIQEALQESGRSLT